MDMLELELMSVFKKVQLRSKFCFAQEVHQESCFDVSVVFLVILIDARSGEKIQDY